MANGIHKAGKALQMQTLQALVHSKSEVTIWLMNQALPIIGRIKGFDAYTITVSGNEGKYHLLFKHGIAGISVEAEIFRNMKFSEEKEVAEAPMPLPESERRSA